MVLYWGWPRVRCRGSICQSEKRHSIRMIGPHSATGAGHRFHQFRHRIWQGFDGWCRACMSILKLIMVIEISRCPMLQSKEKNLVRECYWDLHRAPAEPANPKMRDQSKGIYHAHSMPSEVIKRKWIRVNTICQKRKLEMATAQIYLPPDPWPIHLLFCLSL